jgi:hypothetical protein
MAIQAILYVAYCQVLLCCLVAIASTTVIFTHCGCFLLPVFTKIPRHLGRGKAYNNLAVIYEHSLKVLLSVLIWYIGRNFMVFSLRCQAPSFGCVFFVLFMFVLFTKPVQKHFISGLVLLPRLLFVALFLLCFFVRCGAPHPLLLALFPSHCFFFYSWSHDHGSGGLAAEFYAILLILAPPSSIFAKAMPGVFFLCLEGP